MKRRQFVQYSSIAAMGALLIRPSEIDDSVNVLVSPDLLNVLGDVASVQEIGKAYRVQFVDEDNIYVLQEMLISSVDELTRESLKKRIRLDFEEGHVVRVKGWILSVTEARQCALYSLLHP